MKAFLINTLVSFLSPPQGPARLHGYAAAAGLDVELLNLNHDIYSHFLSSKTLRGMLHKARPWLQWSLTRDTYFRRNFGSVLAGSSAGEMTALLAGLMDGDAGPAPLCAADVATAPAARALAPQQLPFVLLDNIDQVAARIGAVQEVVDERFLHQDPADLLVQLKTLLCGKAVVDALHYPAQIDFGLGFQGAEWVPTAPDVMRATTDRRHNWLIGYFETMVLPRLRREEPALIGISATHMSELIPAFTLARLVKDALPDTHITLGGAAVTDIRDRLAGNPPLWTVIDSVVYGPGERAFVALADALAGNRALAQVPNLIYGGDAVRYSDQTADVSPEEVTTPLYEGLRPGAVLGLETACGCYWGKCTFCYYPRLGGTGRGYAETAYRQRPLELVFEDMRALHDKHAPALIALTDSAVSPSRLESLASWNRSEGPSASFSAFLRLETPFASETLCDRLAAGGLLGGQAGLETGTERVNSLMNKGIEHNTIPAILRTMRDAGILLHLYAIVGYPGETEEEAFKTCAFLREHHQDLALDWEVFGLGVRENGPLAERASELGLGIMPLPTQVLASVALYHNRDGLSSPQAHRLARQFEETLAPLRHPHSKWMDRELYRMVLLAEHAWNRQPGRPNER